MRALGGKVAVVTGAGSGIGLAMAGRFAGRGMRVVMADVDDARVKEAADDLVRSGRDVLAVQCDASLAGDVERLAARTVEHFGAVHVVCNNAGVIGGGDAWTGPLALWDRVLGVNLYGVIHGVRTFLPLLLAQGEGHIVNTASMAGLTPMPGAVPYTVSKHGVVALSESLFLELQMLGSPVGVSCLCPGFVRTELMATAAKGGDDGQLTGDAATTTFGLLRQGIEQGMSPTAVADEVVDAIVTERFWILTHRESRHHPIERMRFAARQENPLLGAPSRHPHLSRLARAARGRLRR